MAGNDAESTPLLAADRAGALVKGVVVSPEEAKLVRKIDWRIIPFVSFLYLLSFLDRSNISNVKYDLSEALGLTETQFARAVSVFYIGYILFEIPANLVLKRVLPSFWIGLMVIGWGICSTCMIFVDSYASLLLVRAFLGVSESGFFPGVIFYLTFWYRRHEQGLRFALFYCSSALAGAFGGLMAYGILQMDVPPLDGWQWLFLIEGIPSIIFGIITWFVLPNSPDSCSWLSEEEKVLAQERLTHLKKVTKTTKFKYVFMTLRSLKIWGFMLINICIVSAAYAVSFYLPAIITEMGFDELVANLLSSPVWFVGALVILSNAFHSDYMREWAFHLIVPAALSIIGFVGVAVCTSPFYQNSTLAYLSMFFVVAGVPPLIPIVLSWMTNVTKGTTRVGTATAMIVGFGNLGGFLGPTIYSELKVTVTDGNGEPLFDSYYRAHLVSAGIMLVCIILCFIMRAYVVEDEIDLEAEETIEEEKSKLADPSGSVNIDSSASGVLLSSKLDVRMSTS